MPDAKFRFIADWPLREDGSDETKVEILTLGDVRSACARVDRLEGVLKETLFGRVAERMGHDLAVTMDKSDWKAWPDYVAFIDPRIEKARKALLDL